jgi:hypothetical protein
MQGKGQGGGPWHTWSQQLGALCTPHRASICVGGLNRQALYSCVVRANTPTNSHGSCLG